MGQRRLYYLFVFSFSLHIITLAIILYSVSSTGNNVCGDRFSENIFNLEDVNTAAFLTAKEIESHPLFMHKGIDFFVVCDAQTYAM